MKKLENATIARRNSRFNILASTISVKHP